MAQSLARLVSWWPSPPGSLYCLPVALVKATSTAQCMKPHERRLFIRRLQGPAAPHKGRSGPRKKRLATYKSILHVLSAYMEIGKSLTCWPGEDTIADDAGCSSREVRRCTEELSKAGILALGWKSRRSKQYTWTATPDYLSGDTGLIVLRVVKRKRVARTHIAGQPICPECNQRPAASGQGTPCLTCIRARQAARGYTGTSKDR